MSGAIDWSLQNGGNEKTGQKIEELPDPSPVPGARKAKQKEQKKQEQESGCEQLFVHE